MITSSPNDLADVAHSGLVKLVDVLPASSGTSVRDALSNGPEPQDWANRFATVVGGDCALRCG
jgi:hypothetical protein